MNSGGKPPFLTCSTFPVLTTYLSFFLFILYEYQRLSAADFLFLSPPAIRSTVSGRNLFRVLKNLVLTRKVTTVKKFLVMVLLAVASLTLAQTRAQAQMMDNSNPMVGGAPMFKSKDIVDNAVNSADHTTLVAAVKAAGLVETLKSKGPFTVFAPTNAAFDKLPAGTVDTLIKPENKGMLTNILTYHVVSGRLDSKAIMAKIKAGKGKAWLKAVNGGTLTAWLDGNSLILADEKGGQSRVTTADVYQSNGVIHVVDSVLLPK
jgi:uncharacterized surface protein with fasciclin (FAS1) repeats